MTWGQPALLGKRQTLHKRGEIVVSQDYEVNPGIFLQSHTWNIMNIFSDLTFFDLSTFP